MTTPLAWIGIVRIGLVQSAIGAMVMLSTSLLNRVMVVEYAMPAAIPAGLVAWHYAVQMSRPVWGHGSDRGNRRTPWIVGGMAVLALGSMLAAEATTLMGSRLPGIALGIVAFLMIGAGVGAAGTSLLALLATRVAPDRRAAAASLTWIMMIVGIVVTAGVAGSLIEPFSPQRLLLVVSGVSLSAFAVAVVAIRGMEGAARTAPQASQSIAFGAAVRELLADPEARRFTIFVFVSMLAYSMQDLILEPFGGLMFAYTPGQTTQLSGVQHMGVLVGMILVGLGGSAFGGGKAQYLRTWTVAGCIGSAAALVGLAMAARLAPHWPIALNIGLLGFANGVFAVAAIGSMMALAGAGGPRREGVRMGVWGAAQAVAFGLGGLIGALGVDLLRAMSDTLRTAYGTVFAGEAVLFLVAAWIATAVAPQRLISREAMTV